MKMLHRVELITFKHNHELEDSLDKLSEEGYELVTLLPDQYDDYWGTWRTTAILRKPAE